MYLRNLAILGLTAALCGCSHVRDTEDASAFTVAAEPLTMPPETAPVGHSGDSTDKKSIVASMVRQSASRCDAFLNRLVVAENTTDTTLDMTTTALAALATAFTPLSTVHALSAAAAISSGWKTAIDSDIYAKASIGLYAQAIMATYYRDMTTYANKLQTMTNGDIVVDLEIYKIQSIHRECSMAAAQATISATLKPKQGEAPTAVETTLKSPTSIAAGTVVRLVATSMSYGVVEADITAANDMKGADISKALLDKSNSVSGFKDHNLKVAIASGAADTLTVSAPQSDGVAWSLQVNKPKPKGKPTPTTQTIQPKVVPASPGGADVTSGVSPGHAVND
jgi:hypothetical protein